MNKFTWKKNIFSLNRSSVNILNVLSNLTKEWECGEKPAEKNFWAGRNQIWEISARKKNSVVESELTMVLKIEMVDQNAIRAREPGSLYTFEKLTENIKKKHLLFKMARRDFWLTISRKNHEPDKHHWILQHWLKNVNSSSFLGLIRIENDGEINVETRYSILYQALWPEVFIYSSHSSLPSSLLRSNLLIKFMC